MNEELIERLKMTEQMLNVAHFKEAESLIREARDAIEKLKWHRYPEEQPNKEGRYLVCYPLGMIPPAPFILIARWGKSEEYERYDKSLKRKKAYWYNIDDEHGDYVLDKVYAWMQLPEPMPLPNERKEMKDD